MYLANKQPHSYHRKKLIRQLLADGYKMGQVPESVQEEPYALHNGPSVDSQDLEFDLKRFHTGEAWYQVEDFATEVSFLGVKAFHHYWPNSPKPEVSHTLEYAREHFFDWLIAGREFPYKIGSRTLYCTCQLIDYTNTQFNALNVFEAWPGCQNNGFAWDLVITINHLPLIGVVYGDTGHLLETAEKALAEIENDKVFGTYIQFLVVTDGHNTYIGSPDDDATAFCKWNDLHDDILSPSKIYDFIYYYLRPGFDEDGYATFVADAQQSEMVQQINAFLKNAKQEGVPAPRSCVGYVLAPSTINNLRHPSPFGWMGAVRQMVFEQNVLLSVGDELIHVAHADDIKDDTEFALLDEGLSDLECAQLMLKHPGVNYVRFLDRPLGPYLVDTNLFGDPICKFDFPIETLEYESGAAKK